jgi:hypothetical protein
MLIALPDVFRGIGIDPIKPGACLIAALASLLRGGR